MKLHLCIFCGGRSVEHEISLLSARNVIAAADPGKYRISAVGIGKDGTWRQYPMDAFVVNADDPKSIALAPEGIAVAPGCLDGRGGLVTLEDGSFSPVDVAFPVMHGTYGEDGSIQGLLRMLNVAVVGCDLASSANAMDKSITKCLLQDAGLTVAAGILIRRTADDRTLDAAIETLGLPLFVKPARLGSSVGVAKARTRAELRRGVDEALRYDTKVLIEEYVPGREIECAVLGNNDPQASVPGEIIPSDDFYSYKAKYIDENGAALVAPAVLSPETTAAVRKTACDAFRALSCSGMSRVDFFLREDGTLVINELNTIPGFTKISMYPKLWELSGIPCRDLVDRLIALAQERHAEETGLATDFMLG